MFPFDDVIMSIGHSPVSVSWGPFLLTWINFNTSGTEFLWTKLWLKLEWIIWYFADPCRVLLFKERVGGDDKYFTCLIILEKQRNAWT